MDQPLIDGEIKRFEEGNISIKNFSQSARDIMKDFWLGVQNNYRNNVKASFVNINRIERTLKAYEGESLRRFLEILQCPDNR